MSRAICSLCLVFSLITLATLTGCSDPGPTIDPAMLAKYSTQLTLADEPDGGQLVSDIRATLLDTDEEIVEEHIHEEGDGHEHETAEEHAEHSHEDGDEAHEEPHEEDDDHGHSEQEHAEHEEDNHEHEATEEHHEHADEDAAHADHGNHDEEHEHETAAEHAEHGNEDEAHEHSEGEHAEHNHDEHAEHAHTEDAHNHEEHAEHDHEGEVVAASEVMDVVLVGQVGGLANPWKETQPDFPFTKNKAVFFLADPIAVVENEESGHNHAPGEECAFCEANAADQSNMLAMVRFLDEKGDVLPMDVRKLFDVKVTDTIVIRGAAQVVEGGMLVVDATGLYIRR